MCIRDSAVVYDSEFWTRTGSVRMDAYLLGLCRDRVVNYVRQRGLECIADVPHALDEKAGSGSRSDPLP